MRWVVFDVYGTLLTSAAGEIGSAADGTHHEESTRFLPKRYVPSHEGGTVSIEMIRSLLHTEIVRHHDRHRTSEIPQPEVDIRAVWSVVLPQIGWKEPPREFVEEIALWYETEMNPLWSMPGAAETIAALSPHYHLGIISNAQFYTPPILETLFHQPLTKLGFSLCIWSYREGVAKPSPLLFDRFTRAATRIDPTFKPGDVLYIGNDMGNDIFPAIKQGYRTALFAGDLRSLRLREEDPVVSSARPDVIITELSQLFDILPYNGESRRGIEL